MFANLLKKARIKWFLLQITLRKEMIGKDKPVEYLGYCAEAILAKPHFSITPLSRGAVIYTPQPAKVFTEMLADILKSLDEDIPAKMVHQLGPFRFRPYLEFLQTDAGCLDDGHHHVLYHLAAINAIVTYINQGAKDELNNNRYNLRALNAIVPDLQEYVDSVIRLYKSPVNI